MADRLLKIGLIGSAVTAVCCFTPLGVIALGAIGLSALAGGIDLVLLPALAGSILLTGFALWRRRRTQ